MNRPETRNLALLRQRIEAADLDAVVAVNMHSVIYLSNAPTAWRWQQQLRADGPRICLVVWPAHDGPAVIVGALEREATEEHSWIERIECYPDYAQSPFEKLAEVLDDMGLRGRRVGIEARAIGVQHWRRLTTLHQETAFVEAGPLLDAVRALKTDEEIRLARRACQLLDRAFVAVFSSARPGMRELELHNAMHATLRDMGASLMGGNLLSGEQALVVHRPMSDRPIKGGDIVRTDYSAWFGGRAANMSRVFVVGEPTLQQKQIYADLKEIQAAVVAQVRPGIPAYDLFRFYTAEVARHGYDTLLPLLGHNIGIQVHEDPMIVQTETGTLHDRMIICLEPLIARQYHIQDQYLITSNGAELLSGAFNTEQLSVID